ncbi:MAG TPA: hypothetical protein DDX71_00865 [Ruminococcus sp.]|nr:hypothetical protein [Ruminococcus sp.]
MLYDNFSALCADAGLTPTKFTTDILKLSSSKVTMWKNGSIPKIEILQEIADYFGVSVGYLFDGGDVVKLDSLSSDERELLENYKRLNDKQKSNVSEYTANLAKLARLEDAEAQRQESVS